MLEKSLYDSWKSRMELYMENRENARMILDSVLHGLLVWPTGLPPDVYAIVNHLKVAKEIWDRVKLLMQGTELSLQEKECLAVPVFTQGDDPIACLNKAMAFLSVAAASRRQGQSYDGTGYKGNATSSRENNTGGQARVVKCYNCQGEGHIARQCTRPKRPRNAAWFKDKAIIPDGQAAQTTIPNNATFQTEDLDAYDSDCDDVSNAKAVLMANLSNYGFDVILEVPHSEPYHNDMDNQSMHAMQDFEHTPVVDFLDNKITSDSNIIQYSQHLQETQQEAVQDTNLKAQRIKPTLYDGSVIFSQRVVILVIDNEETLILKEVGRSKMLTKQNDPISKEKKIKTTPINYVELNQLSKDFELKLLVNFLSDSVNLEMQRSESCDKCFDLDAELLTKQNAYNELLKSYSQLEKHCISLELSIQLNQEIFHKDKSCDNQNALEIPEYFENNDLKAQVQAKDTIIHKLKEHIKSMRENDKEEKVKQDIDEIETISIELEHTCVRTKEHSESLIAQLNSKSVENADLKAQIQDKVFVITSLKNDLRKLTGKEIVENVAQLPNATTFAPGMFKLDIEPISYRLKNNRDAMRITLRRP
ncbi:retrovirus-related pol polyprotein from transposon TNT 1-94 [Tanacetum coccineum]